MILQTAERERKQNQLKVRICNLKEFFLFLSFRKVQLTAGVTQCKVIPPKK